MPKTTKSGRVIEDELPSTLQRSDEKAQRTYAKTHDSALDSYDGDERAANQVAFAALKHTHEKVGDHWEPKPDGRKGPSDARAADPDAAKRDGGTSTGGVDVIGNTKDELLERARQLEVKGRSRMTKQELGEAIKRANDRASAKALEAERS